MWRSQLSNDESLGLRETIALQREWDGQRREIRLWRNDGTFTAADTDIHWTYNIPPGHPDRKLIFAWIGHSPRVMQRKTNFTCGKSDDVMNHALLPLGASFPTVANVFVTLDTDRPVSATNALLAALVAPYHDDSRTGSVYLDLARVTRELAHASDIERDYDVYLKTALGILMSAVEQGAAAPTALEPLASIRIRGNSEDRQLGELLTRLDTLLFDNGLVAQRRRDGEVL